MTTRRWMLAIAIVALLLGAKRLAERRAYFLMRAEVEADRADDYIKRRACLDVLKDELDREGMSTKLGDHYLRLARKYQLAAARPWPHVEADTKPPAPETADHRWPEQSGTRRQ